MKFEIAKSTACLMLKDDNNNLLDYQFINKWYFENLMTQNELIQEIAAFLKRNGLVLNLA
jgi:hypothetical protein